MDHLTHEKRSWNMSRIKSKNTEPEKIVRSALHKMGYRFRLDGKISKKVMKKGVLPGKPDIVLSKYKTVIFIHGCFWHAHENCKDFRLPKTNMEWWSEKLSVNKSRDKQNINKLEELGWSVVVIWECEIKSNKKNIDSFIADITSIFLNN